MPIHPTAIIDRRADLDSSVEVGPFCVIEANVRVAAGCRLFHGVYLTGWTDIAENCVLHPGVIVGHEPQDIKYKGERSFCRIGPRTIIREYATVHRGTVPESATVIGADCFLLAGVHVAHNCTVGNNVTMINGVLLGGHVTVGDRATLGGASVVHQFTRVGELSMLAGRARVVQDVLPFAMIEPGGKLAGLNRVGLKRASLSAEEVREIHQVYRLLYSRVSRTDNVVERIAELVKTPAGLRLLDFLRAPSHRGLTGRYRPRQPASDPSDDESDLADV